MVNSGRLDRILQTHFGTNNYAKADINAALCGKFVRQQQVFIVRVHEPVCPVP